MISGAAVAVGFSLVNLRRVLTLELVYLGKEIDYFLKLNGFDITFLQPFTSTVMAVCPRITATLCHDDIVLSPPALSLEVDVVEKQ